MLCRFQVLQTESLYPLSGQFLLHGQKLCYMPLFSHFRLYSNNQACLEPEYQSFLPSVDE